MRNPSRLLNWLVKVIGACLVVSVLGALMSTDVLLAETLPSVESILDEAIESAVPSAVASDADSLLEIAIRQAKVRSCDKANGLFRMAMDLGEKWAKGLADSLRTKARTGFLGRFIEAQRRAGCVEGIKHNEERLLAFYQEQNQNSIEESADSEFAVGLHKLQLQMDLGYQYLSMGDLDEAHNVASKIIQQIRLAKWRPSIEFERAAVLLAQLGRDEEAFEVVNQYERFFETRPEIKESPGNTHFWIYRVGNLVQ